MNYKKGILGIIPIIFLAWIFALSLVPLRDYDVWWHLKGGQWMIENHSLPVGTDPFSFATSGNVPRENPMTIQWLGEVIFYSAYAIGGLAGVSVLRAIMLAAPFFILYILFLRRGIGAIEAISYLSLPALTLTVFFRHAFERPQAFGFSLALIAAALLESYREKPGKRILWLIPLMVFWANLHGSYVLGCVLLAVYAVSETVKRIFRTRGSLDKGAFSLLLAVCLVSIAATMLNPNGPSLMMTFAGSFLGGSGVKKVTLMSDEWMGLFEYWRQFRTENSPPFILAFISLSVLALLIGWISKRRADLTQMGITAFATSLGLSMIRGVMFAFLLLPLMFATIPVKIRRFFSYTAAAATIVLVVTAFRFGFDFRPSMPDSWVSSRFPVKAVGFIQDNGISGNMFNYREWGGYLIFNGMQTFTDPRTMDFRAHDAYVQVISGARGWDTFLNAYDTSFFITPVLQSTGSYVLPLMLEMSRADADDWRLVFYEDNTAIFLKRRSLNNKIIEEHEISKAKLLGDVLVWAQTLLRHNPDDKAAQTVKSISEEYLSGHPEGAAHLGRGPGPSPH